MEKGRQYLKSAIGSPENDARLQQFRASESPLLDDNEDDDMK
jgi:hypothetical protein